VLHGARLEVVTVAGTNARLGTRLLGSAGISGLGRLVLVGCGISCKVLAPRRKCLLAVPIEYNLGNNLSDL